MPETNSKEETVDVFGIFCCVALLFFILLVTPNISGAQRRAKEAAIQGNLRTLQNAIESSTDTGGIYHLPTPMLNGEGHWKFLELQKFASKEALVNWLKTHDKEDFSSYEWIFCSLDRGNSYAVMRIDEQGHILKNSSDEPVIYSNQ